MKNYMFLVLSLFFCFPVFAESAVCLYSEPNYGGREKCIDSKNGVGSRIKLADFSDMAKSARVFPGFTARLYQHYDSPGNYVEINQDIPDLAENNNQISSISISVDENLSGYTACFFEHPDYHGRRLCFKNGTDIDLWANGFNDMVSSVKVRADYGLRLYENSNFSGRRMTISGNISNLGSQFNDIASSARAFMTSSTFDKTILAIGSDPQLFCTSNCNQNLTEDMARQNVQLAIESMLTNNDVNSIFINGDLTEYGHGNEWTAFFNSMAIVNNRASLYWGLGNHDYLNNQGDTYQNNAYVRTMRNIWEHLSKMTSIVYDATVNNSGHWVISGSLGYAVDLGDIYYIQLHDHMVDNGYGYQLYNTYDYNDLNHCCSFYGSNLWSTKNFLQKQLEFAAQNDKVVVIGKHRPAVSPEIAELIKEYDVKLLFAGHYHQVGKDYSQGLTFYNSGSMAKGSHLRLTVNKNSRTATIVSVKTSDSVESGSINEIIELPIVTPKYMIGEGLWIK
ncbi:TPA: peptidase inhibitor family I36 protein [Vibrio cholerae]|nr:peptidase inhibitor family I36 protein [Vibrio cholerae]